MPHIKDNTIVKEPLRGHLVDGSGLSALGCGRVVPGRVNMGPRVRAKVAVRAAHPVLRVDRSSHTQRSGRGTRALFVGDMSDL